MATGTQLVKIKRTSDNQVIYTCTTPRNTANDPLTTDGNAAFAVKAQTGQLRLTVDNGAVIPIGTIPPLIKPDAPVSGAVPAFEQKIQAEVATGTGTVGTPGSANVGDGNTRGGYTTSADYLTFNVTGAPKTASNYGIAIRYQTNYDTGSTGETGLIRMIINGNTPQDLPAEGAAGGYRTINLTNQSLMEGPNTIRFEGIFRTYFLDYIIVTRPASS